MNEIRAFVGHSFSRDDQSLVRIFLDYFSRLSQTLNNFSWQNAEDAEPKALGEKVLSTLEGKNLFIGICTKRERVIDDKSLRKCLVPRTLKGKESDFQWKASDWVIQELGLAIGRKLKVILLIEDGVRNPGAMADSLEYISFERDFPEKSFSKLLQMIAALTPHSSYVLPSPHEVTMIAREPKILTKENNTENDLLPKPNWNRMQYEISMYRALYKNDVSIADQISDSYLSTENADLEGNRASWAAICEHARIVCSENGDLNKLKSIAAEHPTNSGVLRSYARALEHYNEFSHAAEYFNLSAQYETNRSEQIRLFGSAALAYAKIGDRHQSERFAECMRQIVDIDEGLELKYLEAMKPIFEVQKSEKLLVTTLERIAELDPSSRSTAFSLAHQEFEAGFSDLSLYHYLRVPENERSSAIWNNLGVAYEEFSAPFHSVSAYRKAEAKGETLATANLANKLINVGFLKDAEEKCHQAMKMSDYDNNILINMTRIRDTPSAEEKLLEPLLERARQASDFFRKFGRNLSKKLDRVAPRWIGPACMFKVTLDGKVFKAVGFQEDGIFALARMSDNQEKTRVEYSGVLSGRSIEGRVTRRRETHAGAIPTLLSAGPEVVVLLTFSDDGEQIYVMEFDQARSRRYYELRRFTL